jgi:hypothetical protein
MLHSSCKKCGKEEYKEDKLLLTEEESQQREQSQNSSPTDRERLGFKEKVFNTTTLAISPEFFPHNPHFSQASACVFVFIIWQTCSGLFEEKTNVLPRFGTISTALPNDVV